MPCSDEKRWSHAVRGTTEKEAFFFFYSSICILQEIRGGCVPCLCKLKLVRCTESLELYVRNIVGACTIFLSVHINYFLPPLPSRGVESKLTFFPFSLLE